MNKQTKKVEISQNRKSIIFDESTNDSDLINISHDHNYPLYIQLDFSNSDEIKGLLTSYLLGKFSSNNITNFISRILSNYADLIFISYQTLKEITEMDIVKYSLNNKLKKLMKINIDLEGEIQDLKQFSETNRMIKEILIKIINNMKKTNKYLSLINKWFMINI